MKCVEDYVDQQWSFKTNSPEGFPFTVHLASEGGKRARNVIMPLPDSVLAGQKVKSPSTKEKLPPLIRLVSRATNTNTLLLMRNIDLDRCTLSDEQRTNFTRKSKDGSRNCECTVYTYTHKHTHG